MNTTLDYVEAVKAKTGAVSDYAVSKILGVKAQTISVWRVGKGAMSDETALKVASILEIEPFLVLASIHAERAKTDHEKSVWKAAFEKLGGMAAAVTLGIMLTAPTPSHASTGAGAKSVNETSDLYIIRNRKRKSRRKGPLSMLLENLLPSPQIA